MATAMSAPAKLATGTGENGPSVTADPNVMARMAPSVAPAVRPRPPRSARPSFPHSSPVSFRTSNRNHREMTRARVKADVGLDTIEPPDHGCREHLAGASLCQHSSVAQQHEIAAERG